VGATPFRPEDVTAEWLATCLGTDVRSFEMQQIGVGVGLLGRLYRVTMDTGNGAASAVAKFPTLDDGARANVVVPLRFYEKEVNYYRELGPTSVIPTAKAYAAEFDEATGDFVLLLEDFGNRRMEDQIAGCPVPDAEAAVDALARFHAVDALARFHAASWDEADLPSWLPAYADPPYPQVIEGMYRQAWPRAVEIFGDHLSPEFTAFGERYPNLVGWFMESLSTGTRAMCHGDYRLDNLFFGTEPSQPRVAAVDWQICFRGVPAYDLAYFVSQSLRTDDRRRHEQALKERYRAVLAESEIDYPLEQLERDYAITVAYCFIYAVVSAGQIDMTNERMRELILGILDRAVVAIEDSKGLDLLPD
jgi:aminoglycoside phosphotransferase (APT) family kinase protein